MNPPTEEVILWKGSPSQWTNIGTYFFCLLLIAGILATYFLVPNVPVWVLATTAIPLLFGMVRWLQTRSQTYEITSERIRTSTGIFSRRTTDLEMYRVRDYTVVEPFWLRMIGRGNLVLETADRTNSQVVGRAVPGVSALKDQVRIHTERMRQRRGVRDLEINPQ